MVAKILGMGCSKCQTLEAKVREVAGKNNIDVTVEKVTELAKIQAYRVMMTPALVIDGTVVSAGKLLSKDEIKKLI